MSMRFGVAALLLVGASLVATPADLLAQKKKGGRDLITREEIQASAQKDMDVLSVIKGLRPHFLAPPRGVRSLGGSMGAPEGAAVYVGGIMQSGFDALTQIMATDIEEVKYLEPSKAQNEYGIRAAGGAVVVKLYDASKVAAKKDSPPK